MALCSLLHNCLLTRAVGMARLVVWPLALSALLTFEISMEFESEKEGDIERRQDVLEVEGAVLQWYYAVTGMHPHRKRIGQFGNLSTGSSMDRHDIELFTRLSALFSPQHIFIVGNAWGYSTLVLSYIFDTASVDAIDPGIEGQNGMEGISLTRKVAAFAQRNVAVHVGYSPKDTHRALRSKGQPYELAFIDGLHTNVQMFEDFTGIYPHLAERSVVVLHDVMYKSMQRGVYQILCTFPEMRFAYYMSLDYKETQKAFGTAFMYRGFPDDALAGLHGLEVPYRCLGGKHPLVVMVPKLWTEAGENDGFVEPRCLGGILKFPLCCAPECAKCGGPLCDTYPGSAAQCCGSTMSKKTCTSDEGPPPCVYRDPSEHGVWM